MQKDNIQGLSQVVRNLEQSPVGVYTHWDCEIDYKETYQVSKLSVIDKWKYFSIRPLCRWDCAMYEMKSKKGMSDDDIAQAESRTSIFTWLKVYDPDTNANKEKVAVNSIIAIAFWFATGLPSFIAFLMFCFGPDINQQNKHNNSDEGKEKNQENSNQPAQSPNVVSAGN